MAVLFPQTVVTANANAFETDATEALTFPGSVVGGRFVVVIVWVTNQTRTISSMTDNGSGGSNTYALLAQGGVDASSVNTNAAVKVLIWGAPIVNAMTVVTTVLDSALATPARMAILEVSGQHATVAEDVAIANNGAVSSTSHPCGPVTTAAAGSGLVGGIAGSNGIYTNESPWTSLDSVTNGHIAYRTVDAAMTTWTPTTSGNENTASVVVAIQPAVVSGLSIPIVQHHRQQLARNR